MTFGKRLSRLRESRNMDQTKLGEILNLSKSTVSAYEHDQRQPSPETIVLIAEIFNVTTDYLLRGEEDTTKDNELSRELKDFIERYNKLDEDEKEFLMKKIEKLTKTLEEM
jgi:transcriptional regulator with XRE-family HTH domain